MKLSTIPKAVKLAALPAIVAIIAVRVVVIASNDNKDGAKTVNLTSPQSEREADKVQEAADPIDDTQKVEQPVVVEVPVAEPAQPAAPVNPYPEGFNIWHAFNRRA